MIEEDLRGEAGAEWAGGGGGGGGATYIFKVTEDTLCCLNILRLFVGLFDALCRLSVFAKRHQIYLQTYSNDSAACHTVTHRFKYRLNIHSITCHFCYDLPSVIKWRFPGSCSIF